MSEDAPVKRWTAKRKTAVVMEIFKGKTTVAEVARQHDLTVSEIESWMDEAQKSMENGFRSRPKDIREQYESELCETREALGEAHLRLNLQVQHRPRSAGRMLRWNEATSTSVIRNAPLS